VCGREQLAQGVQEDEGEGEEEEEELEEVVGTGAEDADAEGDGCAYDEGCSVKAIERCGGMDAEAAGDRSVRKQQQLAER
jgi:hypothetical protein